MKMDDLVEIDYDHEVRAQNPNPIGTPNRHRIPKLRIHLRRPSRHEAGESKHMAKKAEEKERTLGTKEVASKIGCKPAALRRFLRSKGKNAKGEYTRYSWKVDSDLSKLKEDFAKYQEANKTKPKPAKKAKAKKTAPKKAAAAKKEPEEI